MNRIARCTAYLTPLLLAVHPAPAMADPTDYANVPTADILKPGRLRLQLVQTVKHFEVQDRSNATNVLTTFGLTERIEAGVDFNSLGDDEKVEADVKYQFADPDTQTWGFAAGATQLFKKNADPFLYATATRKFGSGSATLGVGSDGDARAFVGASYAVTSQINAIGEYMTGEQGFGLVGSRYSINQDFSVAGWYQAFHGTDAARLQVNLIYEADVF